jgi:hypothetical protein
MSLQVATNPEALNGIVSNKDLYDKIMQKGEVARAGDVKLYHTITVSDPKKALVGPVTEFYGS